MRAVVEGSYARLYRHRGESQVGHPEAECSRCQAMKYRDKRQQVAGMALISMFSQVGCVTVIIVAVALVLGLWLDSTFDTRPLFTVATLLVSVPVNVFLLVQIARSTAERLSVLPESPQDTLSDEESS